MNQENKRGRDRLRGRRRGEQISANKGEETKREREKGRSGRRVRLPSKKTKASGQRVFDSQRTKGRALTKKAEVANKQIH